MAFDARAADVVGASLPPWPDDAAEPEGSTFCALVHDAGVTRTALDHDSLLSSSHDSPSHGDAVHDVPFHGASCVQPDIAAGTGRGLFGGGGLRNLDAKRLRNDTL